jgi:hypothetical protein
MMTKINGKTYQHSKITCVINGSEVNGITAIEYEQQQACVAQYGAGGYFVGHGRGRIESKVFITFDNITIIKLDRIHVQDYNFDITVEYGNAGIFITDTLKSCTFKGTPPSRYNTFELMCVQIETKKPF